MRLHFKTLGAGSPLIILHGLFGSGDNWYSIARSLSPYFRLFLLDQRNHGMSPHEKIIDYQAMTGDLEEFFREQQLEEAYILGHSMGGKVAMNFTLRHPSLVKKLIVIDIAMRSYINSPQLLIFHKYIDSLTSLDIKSFKSRTEIDSKLAEEISQQLIRQFLLKNVKRDENSKFYWGLNLEAISENIFEIVDKIDSNNLVFHGPTMIISGKTSGYINSDDRATFKKVFPDLRFEEIDAGHWIHYEQPGKLTDLILDFLEKKSEK